LKQSLGTIEAIIGNDRSNHWERLKQSLGAIEAIVGNDRSNHWERLKQSLGTIEAISLPDTFLSPMSQMDE
jgi:hypothetical protein